MKYTTKDSGKRETYDSGMTRDLQEGKPRYDLCYEPLLTRWAELMARGAEKYGEENWKLANSVEELKRFVASGYRHFVQATRGDDDEDHFAAVLFNLGCIIYLMDKLGVDVNGSKKSSK